MIHSFVDDVTEPDWLNKSFLYFCRAEGHKNPISVEELLK